MIHVQVILDRLGFAPDVIDGLRGQNLKSAVTGFQTANNLRATGELDRPTMAAIARHKAVRPTVAVVLSPEDLAGPYIGALPDDPADQARLPAMGYANRLEKLAEKFHTTPATLIALNSPATRLAPGTRIVVPNVVVGQQRYDEKLTPEWRRTLADLNVAAAQPQAERIVVDKSESVLKVYDEADRLVAQFPATMGSRRDPLPIGSWKVQGAAYNPPFHYNPDLFWDASSKDEKQLLKPGPNGPVGVVWLDLNKPHYGIHGTPSPETIGRAESHGCIRLSNWNAARLALMVKPGTPAKFQA